MISRFLLRFQDFYCDFQDFYCDFKISNDFYCDFTISRISILISDFAPDFILDCTRFPPCLTPRLRCPCRTSSESVYMFRANREFAQTQDCPAQTRNSNFAAQSWDCAASSALERHFIGHPTCKVAT